MTEKLPKALYKGELDLVHTKIKCYVLEDGRRIIAKRSAGSALAKADDEKRKSGDWLPRLVKNKELFDYMPKQLIDRMDNPIEFDYGGGPSTGKGFEAALLPELCDAIFLAKKEGKLGPNNPYFEAAEQAELLLRGLAKVGIIALIDEATGYQNVREKDALRKILEKYISPILLPYASKFPREFYIEIYRLRGWDYGPVIKGQTARTPLLGKITNDIVYNRLMTGALKELEKINPERDGKGKLKYHHHRHLTEGHGVPMLDKHLSSIVTIMKLSETWVDFMNKLNKVHPLERDIELEESQLRLFPKIKTSDDIFDEAIKRASQPD